MPKIYRPILNSVSRIFFSSSHIIQIERWMTIFATVRYHFKASYDIDFARKFKHAYDSIVHTFPPNTNTQTNKREMKKKSGLTFLCDNNLCDIIKSHMRFFVLLFLFGLDAFNGTQKNVDDDDGCGYDTSRLCTFILCSFHFFSFHSSS